MQSDQDIELAQQSIIFYSRLRLFIRFNIFLMILVFILTFSVSNFFNTLFLYLLYKNKSIKMAILYIVLKIGSIIWLWISLVLFLYSQCCDRYTIIGIAIFIIAIVYEFICFEFIFNGMNLHSKIYPQRNSNLIENNLDEEVMSSQLLQEGETFSTTYSSQLNNSPSDALEFKIIYDEKNESNFN